MCAYPSKGPRRLNDYEDDGLTAKGRKNARHAEDIHAEVASTREVMAAFLARQLAAAHPEDWQEVCVKAAFDACGGQEFRPFLADHYDIANFDIRSLVVLMEYNLPLLTFEHGATVTADEIRAFATIRNLYEHRDPRLNYRRWMSDLETIQTFRAKMQTDDEMSEESYTTEELPQMEQDTAAYLSKLDALQHQLEAVTNTVLGLDKRLDDNTQEDIEQSAELNRQKEADREQLAELHRQQQADEEHDRLLDLLKERDVRQHKEILGLLGVSALSLSVSLAALLRKRV